MIWEAMATQGKANKGHKPSVDFIDKWYCHAAIAAIEYGEYSPKILAKIPPSFIKCDFYHNEVVIDWYRIYSQFISLKTATAIHLMNMESDGSYLICHTILFLGFTNLGQAVFWEKKAATQPFRLSTLETIIEDYPNYFWGFHSIGQYS